MASLVTPRSRREEILDAAARLFAERGFHGVPIEDIGRAVGVSGPALYRHFAGKEAVLTQMLLAVSERLLADGTRQANAAGDPAAALDALIRGHVEFALSEPALITVHDRELGNVPDADRQKIRRLQRRYVERWVDVLGELFPSTSLARRRAATHAVFGLLNSTPHSYPDRWAASLSREAMAVMLRHMAHQALGELDR